MDLQSLEWSRIVCEALDIPISCLPKIVSSAEKIGVVDGSIIPSLSGVPLTSLIGDQHAALLGHGCLEKHQCKITYGTGCFLLMNTGTDGKPNPSSSLLSTVAFKLGPSAPAIYALEGSVASAGRSVQWAKDNLRIGEDLKEFNAIASSVDDTCGVTFVPAFSGLFAPYWREDARAVVVGMSLRSNYRHIARSILEATALQCAQVVDVLEKEGSVVKLDAIVTDGGMTKSDLLMQIQADLLGTKILRNRMTEATAFGAAYAAGLSVNFWDKDVRGVISNQEGHDVFNPQMGDQERGKIFSRWHDAVIRSFDLAKFT